jgi:hypothetical protein
MDAVCHMTLRPFDRWLDAFRRSVIWHYHRMASGQIAAILPYDILTICCGYGDSVI